LGAAACQNSEAHDGQDRGFGNEQNSQDLRADVDAPVAEEPDGRDGYQGNYRPRHLQAKEGPEHPLGLNRE
jgi:hypothetical protein